MDWKSENLMLLNPVISGVTEENVIDFVMGGEHWPDRHSIRAPLTHKHPFNGIVSQKTGTQKIFKLDFWATERCTSLFHPQLYKITFMITNCAHIVVCCFHEITVSPFGPAFVDLFLMFTIYCKWWLGPSLPPCMHRPRHSNVYTFVRYDWFIVP